MPTSSGLSNAWLMRFGLMTVMMVVGAAWFSYDGWMSYPAENERWQAYEDVKDDPGAWEPLAQEKGWPTAIPKTRHTEESIMTQQGIGLVCGVIGLGLLIWIGIGMKNKVAADEQGIRACGQTIPYASVKNIDKSRWDSKGIAVVHYEHEGKPGKVTIDDYKYQGGEAVLNTIEQKTGGAGEPADNDNSQ